MAMAQVQNLKERIYNGVGHLGTLEVSEEEVQAYEDAGFQRIDQPTVGGDEGNDQNLLDMKKDELLSLAVSLGAGEEKDLKNHTKAQLAEIIEKIQNETVGGDEGK